MGSWPELCQEIAYFFAPQKADFTDEIYLGEEFADHITDPLPISMARDLGDAVGTMLRSGDWYRVSVNDPELEDDNLIRRHLDFMTDVGRNMLYDRRANFRRMAKQHEFDFVTFGVGVSSITLNKRLDGFVFKNHHPRDCAYAENDEGHIDRIACKFKATARKIYDQFKDVRQATIPEDIKTRATGPNPDDEVEYYHVVVPIDMYDPETRGFPKDAKFASVYISNEGDIIHEMPAYEFPYIVSRWRTVRTWGPYAFSPATMTALPHARMLQSCMLSFIEAGEKAVNPPLVATTEAISSPIDLQGGGVTWVDSEYDERTGAPLRPLDLGKNVPLNEAMLDSFHRLMADTMYISKLNLPGSANRGETAYEVSQIVQQNIRQLQPIFEPIEDEIITQYLDRIYSTGLRMGAFGPIDFFPEELQGREITYSFNNPLTEERERKKVAQFQETAGVLRIGAELDPSLVLETDPVKMMRDAIQGIGAPADWMQPAELAAQQREAQRNAQAQQAQMQQLGQVAEVAKMGGEAAQAIEGAMNGNGGV